MDREFGSQSRWAYGLLLPILVLALFAQHSSADPEAAAGIPNWSAPFQLSAGVNAYTPELQHDSTGNLMAMYMDADSLDAKTPTFRIWDRSSRSWSPTAVVHNSESDDFALATFAFDSNDVAHAVWVEWSDLIGGRILYARQDQWPITTPTVVGSTNPGFNASEPAIAIDSNDHLHVVWSQGISPNATARRQIYYASSTNSGSSWSTPAQISTLEFEAELPDIAIDSAGNIHVVWQQTVNSFFDSRIYYFEIGSGESPAPISPAAMQRAKQPRILADGQTVHVAFVRRIADNEQYAYHQERSAAGNWLPIDSPEQVGGQVSLNTQAPFVIQPAMVMCGGLLNYYYHAVLTGEGAEQLIGYRLDDQNGWSVVDIATETANGSTRAIRPAIACTGDVQHIAYEQLTGTSETERHDIVIVSRQETVFLPVVVK